MAPLSSAWDGWGLGGSQLSLQLGWLLRGVLEPPEPPRPLAPELVSAWVRWEGVQPVPVSAPWGSLGVSGLRAGPPCWGDALPRLHPPVKQRQRARTFA